MEFVDSVVRWATNLTGADVISVILVFSCGSLLLTAVRNSVKVVASVILFLAVLYMVDPNLYSSISSMINRFIGDVSSFATSSDFPIKYS